MERKKQFNSSIKAVTKVGAKGSPVVVILKWWKYIIIHILISFQ